MLTKSHLIDLITEERNRYNTYISICAYYEVLPDPIVMAKCLTKIEAMESLLKLM